MAACLICVVSGKLYQRYARQLFDSAKEHFPGDVIPLVGRSGWPAATLYRYHVILKNQNKLNYQHLFLCDADMRFEAPVGEEIFSPLVATQHPGYVGSENLPYEHRPSSAAYVRKGTTYYAGGFVGGERDAFLDLAQGIRNQIDRDDEKQIMARWHDESHLNAQLALLPPTRMLSPSYCYPDDDSGYPWLEGAERILVALDKTPEERNGR